MGGAPLHSQWPFLHCTPLISRTHSLLGPLLLPLLWHSATSPSTHITSHFLGVPLYHYTTMDRRYTPLLPHRCTFSPHSVPHLWWWPHLSLSRTHTPLTLSQVGSPLSTPHAAFSLSTLCTISCTHAPLTGMTPHLSLCIHTPPAVPSCPVTVVPTYSPSHTCPQVGPAWASRRH